ncbi:MAG: DUF4466 family protein [Bacteroidales bacterium]|nr:DUF4466 family protein [Bacteroidales bacterium]
MRIKYGSILLLLGLVLVFAACDDEDYNVPEGVRNLSNDCIKRSLGPNVVGNEIAFAYAMALPPDLGNLSSVRVEASIAGASGTYLEHRSFYTHNGGIVPSTGEEREGGADIGIVVGSPSVTNEKITEVAFVKDTSASTLRYYYVIPEAAKGKSVSFTFSATATNGQSVSYNMGPYEVGKIEMKREIVLTNNSYFSIADFEVYDEVQAAANPEKIDLVYFHRGLVGGVSFGHSLVSPGADSEYLPGVTLPQGVNNQTYIRKDSGSRDQHLAQDRYGVFVDDIDLLEIDLSTQPFFSIGLQNESGAWIETADGKYRAYLYVNLVDNAAGTMTVSVKRLLIE